MRRIIALIGTLCLMFALVACGEDSGDDKTTGKLDVSGDFGKAPEVSWDGKIEAEKTSTDTLIEGDGEEVKDGDTVNANVWVGNGYSQKEALSTWKTGKPEAITLSDQLPKAIQEGIEGEKLGSRVQIIAPPKDAYGEQGNPSLGIGNTDTVVFIIDLESKAMTEPEGEEQKYPADLPQIKGGDTPTGFDFPKGFKPSDKLVQQYVIKGEGPKVKKGQSLTANYLGQVVGGKVFDQSYDKGAPTSFPIGVGQVVKGWDQGLVGVPVGSRVVLVIPPDLGYGPKGNPQAGIKGTDTMVFVVDVLGAS